MAGFDNKTIWITGASSGIGLELSKQFAARGARIVLSARRKAVLQDVAASLPGGLERHWVAPLDLEDVDNIAAVVKQYQQAIGPVDMLINNGGISQRSLLLETELSVYRRLMDVNYLATVAMTKALLPDMVQRGEGTIVCVSSVAGKIGSKLRTGYSGAKFAVVGFMDCLRAETSAQGIKCITVCPGSIKTNIAVNALTGSGEAQQRDDESIVNGMPVEDCVRKMIRAIANGRDEVVIGKGISALGPTIKRFFPGLYNRLAAKMEYR